MDVEPRRYVICSPKEYNTATNYNYFDLCTVNIHYINQYQLLLIIKRTEKTSTSVSNVTLYVIILNSGYKMFKKKKKSLP